MEESRIIRRICDELGVSLRADTMSTLNDFMVLWSLYDKNIFSNKYSNKSMKEKVDTDVIHCDVVEGYNYMMTRYIDNIDGSWLFDNLHFRSGDYKSEVYRILHDGGSDKEMRFAVLIIIYRLRNNLFHGLKEVSSYNSQQENFRVANDMLEQILFKSSPKHLGG